MVRKKHVQLTYQSYEKCVAAIRMSSHKLHVETGRYKTIPRRERICRGCTTADKDIIGGFLHLPECELLIKDENHCLFDCSFYSDIRTIYVVDGIQSEMASCPQKVFENAVSNMLFDKLDTAVLKKHRTLLQLINQ